MNIDNIFIHHSGGAGNNNFASTRHHTVSTIDDAHKDRWKDLANSWPAYKSQLGYHVGYNFVYDPKTRAFTQTRMIGEETAAARGFNFNSVHVCIIGNYNYNPNTWPRKLVDRFEQYMLEDMISFLYDLINGNRRGYKIAPGTRLNLSAARMYPHRHVSDTMCYGTGIPDTYFQDQYAKYRPKSIPEKEKEVAKSIKEGKPKDLSIIEKLKARNPVATAALFAYIRLYNATAGRRNRNAGVYFQSLDWKDDEQ